MPETGLTEAEWAVVEHLGECHSLLSELDGLDFERFDHAIQGLQDQVFALPARRAARAAASEVKVRRFPNQPAT
jgi:hypothetical protein